MLNIIEIQRFDWRIICNKSRNKLLQSFGQFDKQCTHKTSRIEFISNHDYIDCLDLSFHFSRCFRFFPFLFDEPNINRFIIVKLFTRNYVLYDLMMIKFQSTQNMVSRLLQTYCNDSKRTLLLPFFLYYFATLRCAVTYEIKWTVKLFYGSIIRRKYPRSICTWKICQLYIIVIIVNNNSKYENNVMIIENHFELKNKMRDLKIGQLCICYIMQWRRKVTEQSGSTIDCCNSIK